MRKNCLIVTIESRNQYSLGVILVGKIYEFKGRGRNNSSVYVTKADFKMFSKLSEMWGADFDRILFDGDVKEYQKLNRAVNKANMKFNTENMNTDINENLGGIENE